MFIYLIRLQSRKQQFVAVIFDTNCLGDNDTNVQQDNLSLAGAKFYVDSNIAEQHKQGKMSIFCLVYSSVFLSYFNVFKISINSLWTKKDVSFLLIL